MEYIVFYGELWSIPLSKNCGIRRKRLDRRDDMVNQTYIDYITSDDWDLKRRGGLELAGFACEGCGAEGVPLEVHHKTYKSFKNESQADLEALCGGCHRIADNGRKAKKHREIRSSQLAGWGRKVYGEDWDLYPGYEYVEEEFYNWLDRKGFR